MNNIDVEKILQCHLNEQPYDCDVEVTLAEAVESGVYGFGTLLSYRATACPEAVITNARVVDFKGDPQNTLIIAVTADVEAVPAYWNDVEAPEGWKK